MAIKEVKTIVLVTVKNPLYSRSYESNRNNVLICFNGISQDDFKENGTHWFNFVRIPRKISPTYPEFAKAKESVGVKLIM